MDDRGTFTCFARNVANSTETSTFVKASQASDSNKSSRIEMASHDNLVIIINQLLKSMDKMGDSLSIVKSIDEEVKAIADDVKSIKSRVENIEEKIGSSGKPSSTSDVDRRLCIIEERLSKLSVEPEKPPLQFDLVNKGRKVKLSNNGMTAERVRPHMDDGGLGGVVSNAPIRDDEVFEVRIDETIDRWTTYGMALGVITSKQLTNVEEQNFITLGCNGTWSIYSLHNSTPGRSDVLRDTNVTSENGYPLDTRHLRVGTVLGIKRCRNGDLHFYLNGEDKGVACRNVPRTVHAFVDIVDYVVRVSVVRS